eukprot:EG_transcript_26034
MHTHLMHRNSPQPPGFGLNVHWKVDAHLRSHVALVKARMHDRKEAPIRVGNGGQFWAPGRHTMQPLAEVRRDVVERIHTVVNASTAPCGCSHRYYCRTVPP